MSRRFSFWLFSLVALAWPTLLILLFLDWFKPGLVGNQLDWYRLFLAWIGVAGVAQLLPAWRTGKPLAGRLLGFLLAVSAVGGLLAGTGTWWTVSTIGWLLAGLTVMTGVLIYFLTLKE